MAGARAQICRWRLATLKCRKEFQSVRKGNRCATRAFVLEGRQRPTGAANAAQARFGFTVTRAMGGAVERNRVRRRLKEIVRRNAGLSGGHDYVLIGRRAALSLPFEQISQDFARALREERRARKLLLSRRKEKWVCFGAFGSPWRKLEEGV